jgi:hypothetical protein
MVLIDNALGVIILNGVEASAENIHIWGETEGEDDSCGDRYGFLMS